MRFSDGSEYIDLTTMEEREIRRLLQRQEKAEGYLTDAELDLLRRFRAEGREFIPERLYTGHERPAGLLMPNGEVSG